MSWFNRFFKRNKGYEFEHIARDVPFSTLVRWFIYDTGLTDPNEAAQILGMTPVSEEGDDKEMQDSDNRLEAIADLMPFLVVLAEISATALTKIQSHEIAETEGAISEEEIESMHSLYTLVSLSSLISGFSTAVELGLISKDSLLTNLERLDMETYE